MEGKKEKGKDKKEKKHNREGEGGRERERHTHLRQSCREGLGGAKIYINTMITIPNEFKHEFTWM